MPVERRAVVVIVQDQHLIQSCYLLSVIIIITMTSLYQHSVVFVVVGNFEVCVNKEHLNFGLRNISKEMKTQTPATGSFYKYYHYITNIKKKMKMVKLFFFSWRIIFGLRVFSRPLATQLILCIFSSTPLVLMKRRAGSVEWLPDRPILYLGFTHFSFSDDTTIAIN